ncbi:3-(3-hydroxy-phenyl)propionate hydroxylase [Striga asiatica]|uniref:3-(3-hydroxy-phenyl)propionate hydroxylase n=1 Tax=Striga asiatica TaxID=4170 RepID=A0A5A7QJF5_STRAF|nr:3-(3-hydroxy-phenyl)propionate hydroxylase [Striga asiatica]
MDSRWRSFCVNFTSEPAVVAGVLAAWLPLKGLWPEKPVSWNMATVAHEAGAPILSKGCSRSVPACREWLGARRNLVHLGCPRISLPEIVVSSARGSPTRTNFSLPENWWPPSCRGR